MTHAHQCLPLLQPLDADLAVLVKQTAGSRPVGQLPARADTEPGGFAVGEEEHAFYAGCLVHAAEGFIEDDQVGLLDDGAEEEGDLLGGEGDVAQAEAVGPVDVRGEVLGDVEARTSSICGRIVPGFRSENVDWLVVARGGVELVSEPAETGVDGAISLEG